MDQDCIREHHGICTRVSGLVTSSDGNGIDLDKLKEAIEAAKAEEDAQKLRDAIRDSDPVENNE